MPKLTDAEQILKNLKARDEMVSDIGAPSEQLRAKADKLENPNGLEANMLRAQGALNEATPAVAGIAAKVPLTSGAELMQKVAKNQENAALLRKGMQSMGAQPVQIDEAINAFHRTVGGRGLKSSADYIRKILSKLPVEK